MLNSIWSLAARNPIVEQNREADPEAQAGADEGDDITRDPRLDGRMIQLETQARSTEQQDQQPNKLSRRMHGDTLSTGSSDSRSLSDLTQPAALDPDPPGGPRDRPTQPPCKR